MVTQLWNSLSLSSTVYTFLTINISSGYESYRRNASNDRFYCAIMPLTIRISGYRISIACVERIDDDPLKNAEN